MMGIYTIRNKITGEIYVGSAKYIPSRFAVHRCLLRKSIHHNPKLQNSWKKYGEESFVFAQLESVSLICDLYVREQAALNSIKPSFNITKIISEPPMLGKTHSASARAKISAAMRGIKRKPLSTETRAKISAFHKGRPLSMKHRAKLAAAKLGKLRGKYSKAHRAAISAGVKAHWLEIRS